MQAKRLSTVHRVPGCAFKSSFVTYVQWALPCRSVGIDWPLHQLGGEGLG